MARSEGHPQNNQESSKPTWEDLIHPHSDGKIRYLHFKPQMEIPSYQEVIETGKPIPLPQLINLLWEAQKYLSWTPGPNQELRVDFAVDWLGPWISYLDWIRYHPLEFASQKIKKTPNEISNCLKKIPNKTSSLLLMGGGEGGPGHRHAVDWMTKHIDFPILLFEHPEYIEKKVRRGEFLPLTIRLSMWTYHSKVSFLGIVPNNSEKLPLNIFYQLVHDQTGADFHFATEGDPHLKEKVSRGKKSPICIIPKLPTPSTTNCVRCAYSQPFFTLHKPLDIIEKSFQVFNCR